MYQFLNNLLNSTQRVDQMKNTQDNITVNRKGLSYNSLAQKISQNSCQKMCMNHFNDQSIFNNKSYNTKQTINRQRQYLTGLSLLKIDNETYKILQLATNGQLIVNSVNNYYQTQQTIVISNNCHIAICQRIDASNDKKEKKMNEMEEQHDLKRDNHLSQQKAEHNNNDKSYHQPLVCIIFQLEFTLINKEPQIKTLHISKLFPLLQYYTLQQHSDKQYLQINKDLRKRELMQMIIKSMLGRFDDKRNRLELNKSTRSNNMKQGDKQMKWNEVDNGNNKQCYQFVSTHIMLGVRLYLIDYLRKLVYQNQGKCKFIDSIRRDNERLVKDNENQIRDNEIILRDYKSLVGDKMNEMIQSVDQVGDRNQCQWDSKIDDKSDNNRMISQQVGQQQQQRQQKFNLEQQKEKVMVNEQEEMIDEQQKMVEQKQKIIIDQEMIIDNESSIIESKQKVFENQQEIKQKNIQKDIQNNEYILEQQSLYFNQPSQLIEQSQQKEIIQNQQYQQKVIYSQVIEYKAQQVIKYRGQQQEVNKYRGQQQEVIEFKGQEEVLVQSLTVSFAEPLKKLQTFEQKNSIINCGIDQYRNKNSQFDNYNNINQYDNYNHTINNTQLSNNNDQLSNNNIQLSNNNTQRQEQDIDKCSYSLSTQPQSTIFNSYTLLHTHSQPIINQHQHQFKHKSSLEEENSYYHQQIKQLKEHKNDQQQQNQQQQRGQVHSDKNMIQQQIDYYQSDIKMIHQQQQQSQPKQQSKKQSEKSKQQLQQKYHQIQQLLQPGQYQHQSKIQPDQQQYLEKLQIQEEQDNEKYQKQQKEQEGQYMYQHQLTEEKIIQKPLEQQFIAIKPTRLFFQSIPNQNIINKQKSIIMEDQLQQQHKQLKQPQHNQDILQINTNANNQIPSLYSTDQNLLTKFLLNQQFTILSQHTLIKKLPQLIQQVNSSTKQNQKIITPIEQIDFQRTTYTLIKSIPQHILCLQILKQQGKLFNQQSQNNQQIKQGQQQIQQGQQINQKQPTINTHLKKQPMKLLLYNPLLIDQNNHIKISPSNINITKQQLMKQLHLVNDFTISNNGNKLLLYSKQQKQNIKNIINYNQVLQYDIEKQYFTHIYTVPSIYDTVMRNKKYNQYQYQNNLTILPLRQVLYPPNENSNKFYVLTQKEIIIIPTVDYNKNSDQNNNNDQNNMTHQNESQCTRLQNTKLFIYENSLTLSRDLQRRFDTMSIYEDGQRVVVGMGGKQIKVFHLSQCKQLSNWQASINKMSNKKYIKHTNTYQPNKKSYKKQQNKLNNIINQVRKQRKQSQKQNRNDHYHQYEQKYQKYTNKYGQQAEKQIATPLKKHKPINKHLTSTTVTSCIPNTGFKRNDLLSESKEISMINEGQGNSMINEGQINYLNEISDRSMGLRVYYLKALNSFDLEQQYDSVNESNRNVLSNKEKHSCEDDNNNKKQITSIQIIYHKNQQKHKQQQQLQPQHQYQHQHPQQEQMIPVKIVCRQQVNKKMRLFCIECEQQTKDKLKVNCFYNKLRLNNRSFIKHLHNQHQILSIIHEGETLQMN